MFSHIYYNYLFSNAWNTPSYYLFSWYFSSTFKNKIICWHYNQSASIRVKRNDNYLTSITNDSVQYLLELILTVIGHPRGSTSYTPSSESLQPYLQWMKSSPICSDTARLTTTITSLILSTGQTPASTKRTKIIQSIGTIHQRSAKSTQNNNEYAFYIARYLISK